MVFRLEFEGIRCFRRKQRVRIAPLTLLVGENSSGKSTVLAVTKIAMDMAMSRLKQEPFNEAPFILGAWDDIAYRSRSGKRASSFNIGLASEGEPEFKLESKWVSRDGHPAMDDGRIISGRFWANVSVWGDLSARAALFGEPLTQVNEQLLSVARQLHSFGENLAMAPIRSSPRRTYDPVIPAPHPDGAHIPHVLANLLETPGKAANSLRLRLAEFGRDSSLFDSIGVERKGGKRSDPFQIRVATGGLDVNLIDAGYGVSQVLPILVDTLVQRKAPPLLLLQQPEVHLHPQAQSALGTFFARSVKSKMARFVIETHSDHIIDRVCMAVRDGVIAHGDVSLNFLEKTGAEAVIHDLGLDSTGQITNAPDGYRQFFLDEERRLLGIA